MQVSGEKVDVTVQLVKPDYLVVSLPRRKPANPPTLGCLSTKVRRQCQKIGAKVLLPMHMLPAAHGAQPPCWHCGVHSRVRIECMRHC